MQKRILRAIAAIAVHHYGRVLCCAVALTVLSWTPPVVSYLRGGLHAPFNIANMLPRDVPAARDFTRALTDFDSVDEAVVVFHLGNAREREPSGAELKANPGLGGDVAKAGRRRARQQYVATAGRVADALAEKLSADPRIRSALSRRFRPEDRDYILYEALPSYGLLLLGESEIPRIRELLQPDEIRRSVRNLKTRINSVMASSGAMEELMLLDAIGLGTVFQRALSGYGFSEGAGAGADAGGAGGYLVDPDATMLLVAIQPDRPAQSVDFAGIISEHIRSVASEAYDGIVPAGARSSIRMEFGGGYEASMSYTANVNANLFSTLLTSLVGVLALFGLVFKRVGVLLYIGIPLVMVTSWTIGIGWLIYGQLNIISASFAAVLVALGIDYAIHIYNRYIGERALGRGIGDAFTVAIENTGWGVIIGMVTTAVAFMSLGATRFSQLAEFGVLAGTGIFLSAPVMLFVLPSLLCWRYSKSGERASTLKPLGLGLEPVGGWVERHAVPAAVGGIVLFIASAAALVLLPDRLRFDQRLSTLRPPDRVFELSGEIARGFSNRRPNGLMLLAYGASEAAAVENAARLQNICSEMERGTAPLLEAHESFLRYIPAPSAQRKVLAALRDIDLERTREVFLEALDDEGLDPEFFLFTTTLLEQHQERVENDDVILPTDLAETPLWRYIKRFISQQRRAVALNEELPEDLAFPVTVAAPAISRSEEIRAQAGAELGREELLALYDNPELTWQDQVPAVTVVDGDGWVVKISVYPPVDPSTNTGDPMVDDAWLAAVRARLGIDRGDGGDGDAGGRLDRPVLAGVTVLLYELAAIVKADFRRVSVAVFLICAAVMYVFFFRAPVRLLTSLLPVAAGLAYLLGFMDLAGIHFNFVNTLVIPIIIGLGVDNGIHLTERFFECGHSAKTIIADTGRALVVTALTSCAGFGSLALSGYEGVASMGRLCIFALGWVLFASLFVTPAIMYLAWRKRRNVP